MEIEFSVCLLSPDMQQVSDIKKASSIKEAFQRFDFPNIYQLVTGVPPIKTGAFIAAAAWL